MARFAAARIIINVVYVASFVSPGGIQPGTLICMGNISARDRLVRSLGARDARARARALVLSAHRRAHTHTEEYIMRVIRTLRSIIIQADELTINERLLLLINVTRKRARARWKRH